MPVRRRVTGKGGGSSPTRSRRSRRVQTFALTGELAQVAAAIHKNKSQGVIRFASDSSLDYGRLRLGILVLDLALAGGMRMSRGVMFYGERAAGKSTLALMAVRSAQQAFPDKVAAWLDIEGTFDKVWATKLGVDTDRLLIVEPETGEEAVDLADAILRANETSIIVTDSIAFLTPMKELDESAEANFPGIHARLIGNYIRRINNAMLRERHRKHNPIVLHLNQFRMKIGVMFGDNRVLPGGKALEFATSQQVLLRNFEHKIKGGDEGGMVDFNEHSFTITKEKTGGRLKEGKFKLIRESDGPAGPEGSIDQAKTILTFGARAGVVVGKYDIDGYGKFRSSDAVRDFFIERPDACELTQQKIIAYYRKKWNVA